MRGPCGRPAPRKDGAAGLVLVSAGRGAPLGRTAGGVLRQRDVRHGHANARSAESSNLIQKLDTPAHDEVRRLIAEDAESRHGSSSTFTFNGYVFHALTRRERGSHKSQLCRTLPNGQEQCAEVALEARDLFQTMQSLGFFCILPHDPSQTFIRCQKMPK